MALRLIHCLRRDRFGFGCLRVRRLSRRQAQDLDSPESIAATQAGSGSQSRQWIRAFIWASFVAWLFFLLWVITYLTNIDSFGDTLHTFLLRFTPFIEPAGSVSRQPCKPDGSFSPFTDKYNWWSSEGFFQITLKVGSLTFQPGKGNRCCLGRCKSPSMSTTHAILFLTFLFRSWDGSVKLSLPSSPGEFSQITQQYPWHAALQPLQHSGSSTSTKRPH